MLIDLDTHPEFDVSERPRRRMHWRGPISLLVVAITLSTVGGHEAAPRPAVERIADITGEFVTWVSAEGPVLYVAGPGQIAAHDMRDGRLLWRQGNQIDLFNMYFRYDLLIISGARQGSQGGEISTIALDRGTGALRWQVPGWVEWYDDNLFAGLTGLIVEGQEEGSTTTFYRGDGTKIWSLEVGYAVGFHADRYVVGTVDQSTGTLTERNARTGALIREVVLPGAIGADGLWYHENNLVILRSGSASLTLDAHSLDPAPEFVPPDTLYRHDCGTVWCQPDVFEHGMELIDKATERVLFHDNRWEAAVVTSAGVVGAVYNGEGRPSVALNVFDPRTRRTTELAGWFMLGVDFEEQAVVVDPVYLTRTAGEQTHFARIATDGVRYIGAVERLALMECASFEQWLACRVDSGLVRLWRLT